MKKQFPLSTLLLLVLPLLLSLCSKRSPDVGAGQLRRVRVGRFVLQYALCLLVRNGLARSGSASKAANAKTLELGSAILLFSSLDMVA
jgi:hypothetical protein